MASVSSSISSTKLLQLTFGNSTLVQRVKLCKILLVGAGGIGCEVLKGLLLTGFPRITIIDLDTIDVSNLNRQFLYNKSHVGQSKAVVAARVAVQRFAHRESGEPISIVDPIHDSILSLKYNKQFYEQFTLVINALDNNTTRVHVNRMCLAADIPLVESASAGYFGNVKLIKRGVTQCFECEPPKKDENTYASCTIRNTPSLPIHCIVWAKHLFAQLFGQADEDISPDATVKNLVSNPADNDQTEQSTENSNNNHQTTRQYVESTDYDPKALFDKIFHEDILYLKSMDNLWVKRQTPRELFYDRIINDQCCFEDVAPIEAQTNKHQTNGNGTDNSIMRDQRLWTMKECIDIFADSLFKLKQRLKQEGTLEWDKDDDDAVDFVAAISNFRCYCFYITRKSKFEVKSLAGNIIPAISTTNTIVGGFVILQTIKLLQSLLSERFDKPESSDNNSNMKVVDETKLATESQCLLQNGFSVFISNKNLPNLSKIAVEPLLRPKSDCMACSSDVKEIIVALPIGKTTLADFIEQIVMKRLKCIAPDVNVYEQRKMLWAADDEEELQQANSPFRSKLLSSYSFMQDNVCLEVKDLEQNFEVILRLRDVEFDADTPDGDGEFFKILNQDELDSLQNNGNNNSKMDTAIELNENGKTIQMTETKETKPTNTTNKRPLEQQNPEEEVVIDDEEEFVCLQDLPPENTNTKRIRIS